MKIKFYLLHLSFIWLFLINIECEEINENVLIRRKRQLIYPNPAQFQLTLGITIPVPLMSKYRAINSNYAYQANMLMPTNLTQVPLFYILGPAITMERRRRQLEEWPKVEYPPVDFEDFQWSDLTSQDMYMAIEGTIERYNALTDYKVRFKSYGYNGKPCLLRSICELASFPLQAHGNDDFIHELIHFVLTPSLHNPTREILQTNQRSQGNVLPDMDPYSEAEALGLKGEDCKTIYSDCEISLFNIFTSVIEDDHL